MEDHDGSYRLLFSFRTMFRDLLTGFIQEDWIAELDFNTAEPIETSFVSEGLRKREGDIIWRVKWRDRWLYVYVLIEMQSSVDPMMAVRLLSYVSLLYQDLAKSEELTPEGRLPPVLPITLYNGKKPWNSPQNLSDLIAPVPGSLQRYQPQFSYFLLDESRLAGTQLPLSNLVSALISVENSDSPQALRLALSQLIAWLDQDTQEHRRLRRTFSVWLGRSLLPSRFPGVDLPEMNDLSEVKSMLSETVVEWTKEWKQEGLEQGLKEGRKLGMQQGLEQGINKNKRDIALKMLKGGLAMDLISEMTELSEDELRALQDSY